MNCFKIGIPCFGPILNIIEQKKTYYKSSGKDKFHDFYS
jgi:hypothetical protein